MKNSYHLREDSFEARWFEGTSHRDKTVIWMHGSGMNEKHCIKDSEYPHASHLLGTYPPES